MALALTKGMIPDLLGVETDGLAVDFTNQGWAQVRISGVDAFSSPHTFFTQSGTSAKFVKNSATTIGWSPHNLCQQSQTFETSWTNESTTETVNSTTAPDGTSTADTLTATAGSAAHGMYTTFTGSSVAGAEHTVSCYLKMGTHRYVSVVGSQVAAEWWSTTFDLQTGTVTQTGAGASATRTGGGIIDMGLGWYRCYTSGFHATVNQAVAIKLNSSGTPTQGSFGNETWTTAGTETVFLWGAQLCRGNQPLAYIATTNATKIGLPISYGEGLLVEPAATNLALQSQTFGTTWGANFVTVTSNSTTAPDGSSTADKMTEDTNNNEHKLEQTITSISTENTLSCYVKLAAGSRSFYLLIGSATGGAYVFFTLSGAGTASNLAAYGTGATTTSSSITLIGDSWYRVTLTATVTAAVTIRVAQASAPDIGSTSYAGDGSSAFYLWGAQYETGKVATSYIPTVAASATRATDAVNVATSAYPHSDSAGTLVCWFTARKAAETVNSGVLTLNDGTTAERLHLGIEFADTPDKIAMFLVDGGATQVDNTVTKAGTISLSGNKAACAYALNNSGIVVDGSSEVSDTVCTMPTVTNLQLGYKSEVASRELNGFIRRLIYVPRRMTTVEMQTATT